MKYSISFHHPTTHFLQVALEIHNINKTTLDLALPIWRPGRYEAANYAKNIRGFKVSNEKGEPLAYEKTSFSSWRVNTAEVTSVIISYDYFANRMDAGSSWYDDEQVYINFINCLIYAIDRKEDPCEVTLSLPKTYRIACGLSRKGDTFLAANYYTLVDSPLMASDKLQLYSYTYQEVPFHVWICGEHNMDEERLIEDFKKFTEVQVDIMGIFPEKVYHFMIQALPYKFYHGVEHHNSTVICIGPGSDLQTEKLYAELAGVSSHELFHAWNIIKIRPQEMMPYYFNNPPFFPTGYVAEGFTTYYGDLFLAKAGFFSRSWYFDELNIIFKRHFHNYGRLHYSVVDSSLDLWADGYQQGAPERKSSIYVEGAMTALCLDLMIRRASQDTQSLDDVMRLLWKEFGQTGKGYTNDDIKTICEKVYGGSLEVFFEEQVHGVVSKESLVDELLGHVGCQLGKSSSENGLERHFGVKATLIDDQFKVIQIAPGSPGEGCFSLGDVLLQVAGETVNENLLQALTNTTYTFTLQRNYKDISINATPTDMTWFPVYTIQPVAEASPQQQASQDKWLSSSQTND